MLNTVYFTVIVFAQVPECQTLWKGSKEGDSFQFEFEPWICIESSWFERPLSGRPWTVDTQAAILRALSQIVRICANQDKLLETVMPWSCSWLTGVRVAPEGVVYWNRTFAKGRFFLLNSWHIYTRTHPQSSWRTMLFLIDHLVTFGVQLQK